jgi:hypothetical protein
MPQCLSPILFTEEKGLYLYGADGKFLTNLPIFQVQKGIQDLTLRRIPYFFKPQFKNIFKLQLFAF